MDTSTLIGTFEHLWEALLDATLDDGLLTGAIAGVAISLTVAGILWFIVGSRHQSERLGLMKTVMETRQELLKVSSLYSVQCQVAEGFQHKLRKMESDMGTSVKHWQGTADAAYQTLRRTEGRSSRLVSEQDSTILSLNIQLHDLKQNSDSLSAAVNELHGKLAAATMSGHVQQATYERDLANAREAIRLLREEMSEKDDEAQAAFEVNRLATFALTEELQETRDTLGSQYLVIKTLHEEVARARQDHNDLQESLSFALKEQEFARHTYEAQVSRLQSELGLAQDENELLRDEVCALEADNARDFHLYAQDEITTLAAQRDEANAHLEDLSNSTMTLVQSYRTLEADHNRLVVQLRYLREFHANHDSLTPGADFAFSPLPDLSPSRSVSLSPEAISLDTHLVRSLMHSLAQDSLSSCGSPDVFGSSSVRSEAVI